MSDETNLHVGAGIYDITGPAAEVGMFGYAQIKQIASGIHMRLRSRAFAFRDNRNRNFVFVSADLGQISEAVTQGVISRLEKHKSIPLGTYSRQNVMISAVHTHCGPGGLSHYALYNFHPPLRGFDKQNYECVVNGIVQSIVRAFTNLQPGYIRVAKGDCLGASINRSSEAYDANPQDERDMYAYNTDKEMTLWRLDAVSGVPIGMINWFAVHPTSMGSTFTLITGDNKGLASHIFERENGTNHLLDKPKAFVAAFAQSNEGDVSPNIFGPRDVVGSENDFERMFIVANAQLKTARELYAKAATSPPLVGRINHRHQYVDFSHIQLKNEFHTYPECPPSTCAGCIGVSMLSGTTYDGVGFPFIPEGVKWGDYKQVTVLPSLQRDQMEKPIALPSGPLGLSPSILPIQLVAIGNTSLIGLPFEITTMAGRRIRSTVVKSLTELGVQHAIIAGLSNAYCGYLVTREEYSIQRYEGASTHFGPNQLCATEQELVRLAGLLTGKDCDERAVSPPVVRFGTTGLNTPVIFDGVLITKSFGDVVSGKDAHSTYVVGDTVKVVFHSGHPKNDLRTQSSFLEVHYKANDKWVMHADDGDENTFYHWNRWGVDASRVTVEWRIPSTTPPGIYRIKHLGNYKSGWTGHVNSFEGTSKEFKVTAQASVID